MDLTTLTYIFVGGSFALYFGIAIWAKAGTTGEFYAAGRGVHPVANGMATAADWMSAASFISMAGLIAFKGYDASIFLMGWTGGYVLLALLLAPYLRKFGKYTVPEFVGDRFYSSGARVTAVVCLIVASITYVIGQVKGIGVAFGRFLEVDYSTGLIIGMVTVAFYAVLGGMKGVTYTQIAQYCVLITAYTVPAVFISLNLTGSPLPQIGLFSDVEGGVAMLTKLDMVITDLGFKEYTAQKGGMVNMLFYTFSLMIGTAGLPHVIIRFFTVPKVRDARATAGWALVFIALLYTVAPAVGAMARLNLMNTVQTSAVGTDGGQQLVYAERPQWFKNWEATGLLKFEDKNGDGKVQYYNDKNKEFAAKAEAWGWKGNEMVKVDRDIMVLANPEIAQLPNWVIALVAAGGLAAALSTAAGLLLAISSAISHDLLKSTFMPEISEKQELLYARLSMIGAIILAGYFGLNPPGFAAQTVALAFGLAASSIFPVLMMGIFSKKMNKTGAIAGMAAGIGSTLLYIFAYKGFFFVKGTELFVNTPANHMFGISPEAFGTVGAILNFAVAFIVMNMSAPVPAEIEAMVEDIRVPRGAGAAQDH